MFGVDKEEFEKLLAKWQAYSKSHVEPWLYISQMFAEFRPEFDQRKQKEGKNTGQAWNNFEGNALEELLHTIIAEQVTAIGLKCLLGRDLTRSSLTKEESMIHRKVSVHFGPYSLLPDPDLIVYTQDGWHVVAVVSSKVSLRERVAQVAYWKRKLAEDQVTAHIKMFFVTLDKDHDLAKPLPVPGKGFKNRILVEYELDGTYVLYGVSESSKVKTFARLQDDLRAIVRRMADAQDS